MTRLERIAKSPQLPGHVDVKLLVKAARASARFEKFQLENRDPLKWTRFQAQLCGLLMASVGRALKPLMKEAKVKKHGV